MIERTFEQFVQDLADRRRLSEPPPIVLLGAGASVESGVGAMQGIFDLAGVADFAAFAAFIETRSDSERYRLLSEFLQTQDPAEVTPGYQALAALCADAVFDVVLTTNLDPLLDDCLAAARLWRRDYLLLVNGVVRLDRLAPLLRARQPRVKVIKLHGDLFQRRMAWTPAEMQTYLDELAPIIQPAIAGRDVLVVGHSLRDARIRDLALGTGGEAIWYVSPSAVPDFLVADRRLRAVTGAGCAFEPLFTRLAADFGIGYAGDLVREAPSGLVAAEDAPVGAQTLDDLMGCVVGLFGDLNVPAMTGFVLADRRLIVTDGWQDNVRRLGEGRVRLATMDGRRFETTIVEQVRGHPFGPLLLAVPPELKVPGLRLDTTPLKAGTPVQIAVAAGSRIGLSSGTVTTGREQRIDIAPIGAVPQLLHVAAAVAPGSSGAPVVDAAMNVRGFVVAGSSDPTHPDSYLYPSRRWGAHALRHG